MMNCCVVCLYPTVSLLFLTYRVGHLLVAEAPFVRDETVGEGGGCNLASKPTCRCKKHTRARYMSHSGLCRRGVCHVKATGCSTVGDSVQDVFYLSQVHASVSSRLRRAGVEAFSPVLALEGGFGTRGAIRGPPSEAGGDAHRPRGLHARKTDGVRCCPVFVAGSFFFRIGACGFSACRNTRPFLSQFGSGCPRLSPLSQPVHIVFGAGGRHEPYEGAHPLPKRRQHLPSPPLVRESCQFWTSSGAQRHRCYKIRLFWRRVDRVSVARCTCRHNANHRQA